MAKNRAQILLEAEQHTVLSELAAQRNERISGVVREIIGEYLVRKDEDELKLRELRAVQELEHLRHELRQAHGVLNVDWLEDNRAECFQDLERQRGGKE
ncbi:MAG: hypothetical protein JXA25_04495 [Anaerolineales bacterium]|nr:hypothetical protein [Anaerolineales bacterium]